MAATIPTDESARITSVSSPSARRLYYELTDRGEASLDDLATAVGYDPDRVGELLAVLDSRGLVRSDGDTFLA
ncbi:MAG: hypothetical protein ABEJ44_02470 [Halanaeroarchaeum sp.]